jgi:hypothetical protein
VAASISNRTVQRLRLDGGTATATYELNNNGNVYNHLGTNLEAWLDSGVNSDFDVRATFVSGDTLASGTLGTWQVLSTTRSWSLTAVSGETKSTTLTVEIRNSSTLAVLTTATISLSAESSTV